MRRSGGPGPLRLAAWALACAVLVPQAGRAPRVLDVNARIAGSESAAVDSLLEHRFGSPFARPVLLVARGLPDPGTAPGRRALERVARAVESVPGVAATLSALDTGDPTLVGPDGAGALVVVGLAPEASPDRVVPDLRKALDAEGRDLRAEHPGATLRLTGEAALNYDLRTASADEAARAERRVLPLTAVLLVVGFGTVAAALVPVATGALAIPLALGAAVWVHHVEPLSVLLLNVVTMIGLGLGIDYALLMVHRYREGGDAGSRRRGLRASARTVTLSGAAVATGFAGLLAVPLNELRSVAVGGLLAVAVSVLLATRLLPPLLEALGPRLEWGRLPRPRLPAGLRRGLRPLPPGPRGTRRPGGWEAWAGWVVAHPVLVLCVSLPPLLGLSAQALRLETGLPRGDWLPSRMESATALAELEEMGRDGAVQTVRVVLELPEGLSAWSPDGFGAARRAAAALEGEAGVAAVRGLPTLAAGHRGPDAAPPDLLGTFVTKDGGHLHLEVLPEPGADADALAELVGELRSRGGPALTGLEGTRMWVGGLPAFNADYEVAVAGRFLPAGGLVVGATLLALMIGFRSVLVPVKAVLLNLFSVGAAFGALVLVFQDGLGVELLGLASAPGRVFPIVPVLVFCVVFGLSMDYEVFLVSRVAEARPGRSEAEAVARGLARTGHVITGAAAVMVTVFGGFTLGDFVLVKMLGFTLAAAVLLDAAVVRVAVGPALLVLLGRWNWWPGTQGGRGGHGSAPYAPRSGTPRPPGGGVRLRPRRTPTPASTGDVPGRPEGPPPGHVADHHRGHDRLRPSPR